MAPLIINEQKNIKVQMIDITEEFFESVLKDKIKDNPLVNFKVYGK